MENLENKLLYIRNMMEVYDELVLILEEHSKLSLTLLRDVAICGLSVYEDSETQFWRRTVLRSFISSIEGIIYSTKNMSLKMAEFLNVKLTDAEIALLRERNYQIKDNGETQISNAKIRTIGNILFTLKICAKSCKAPEIVVDKHDIKWKCFLETIKLRHRVTHPQQSDNLAITDEEFKVIEDAVRWFTDVNNNIHKTFEYAVDVKRKELKEYQ